MKKMCLVLISLALFATFVYSIPTDEQIRQAANSLGVPFNALKEFVQSYQPQAVPAGVISIAARDLVAAYRDNQAKADSQYTNKIVQVTGEVKSVKQDSGEYYVELSGPTSIYTVNIYVQQQEISKIAYLDVGQNATLIGMCIGMGYSIFTVRVEDAILVIDN